MKPAEQQQIVAAYLAAYNSLDVDGMIALLDEDVIFRNVAQSEVTHETNGLSAFRDLAEQGAAMFSERTQELVAVAFEQRGEEAVLVATIRFRGVQAAEGRGGSTAGETIMLTGRSEFSFRHGKIAAIVDFS